MRTRLLLLGCALTAFVASAAAAQDLAVVGGRVLTGTGVIENGTVVIRNGVIASVGTGPAPSGVPVVDARGKVVTPGFVAVDSGLGAQEISSVGGSVDQSNNANSISAAFDISYGLDPWSIALPAARLGGITRAVVTPNHSGGGDGDVHDDSGFAGLGEGGLQSPGLFAGQAAVIRLADGPDILMQARVAMVAPFGESGAAIAGGARGAQFIQFRETLSEVRLYARNKSDYEEADLRALSLSRADLEALIPVVNGTMPVIISVHRAADIIQVLRLAENEGITVILDGAEEAWMVADRIKAAMVPVLLNPIDNLPGSLETRGARSENAAALDAAGVLFAIKGNAGSVHRAREMRYNAGNAVSHGLPFERAIAALTVNPAHIFGLRGQVGELTPGAAGDVVIWSGDPLEPLSQAEAVYIDGQAQPLVTRDAQLFARYRNGGRQAGGMPVAYGQ